MIEQKFQESNFDCGQTCLDMLGYDGHGMFPNQEVASSDLRSIPEAREVTVPCGEEETLDYTYPHIWILLGKGKVAGAQHWVIRHGDKNLLPNHRHYECARIQGPICRFCLATICRAIQRTNGS